MNSHFARAGRETFELRDSDSITFMQTGARAAAIVFVLTGALAGTVHEHRLCTLEEGGSFPELADAGRRLSRVASPEILVFDRKPCTAFYPGARSAHPLTGSYDEGLDAAVAQGGVRSS